MDWATAILVLQRVRLERGHRERPCRAVDLQRAKSAGGLYERLREVAQFQRDEQQAWADIRQLENLDIVEPQTRSSVRSALAQARLIDWNIRVDLEVTIARARKLGPNTSLKRKLSFSTFS